MLGALLGPEGPACDGLVFLVGVLPRSSHRFTPLVGVGVWWWRCGWDVRLLVENCTVDASIM